MTSFYNYYDTKADLLITLGLSSEEALRKALAGFWRTYAKRCGELASEEWPTEPYPAADRPREDGRMPAWPHEEYRS